MTIVDESAAPAMMPEVPSATLRGTWKKCSTLWDAAPLTWVLMGVMDA